MRWLHEYSDIEMIGADPSRAAAGTAYERAGPGPDATGLAQCAERTRQLRSDADEGQVEGASAALQHNLGLGGAVVVRLYRRDPT